jgi:hypothetical protein
MFGSPAPARLPQELDLQMTGAAACTLVFFMPCKE